MITQSLSVSCSSLIKYAQGLADTVNTQYVSYLELTNALNESWRDCYEFLTDSSTDYFLNLTQLTVASTSSNTSGLLNPNEYLVTLPTDFYKLSFLDYNWNGVWQRMRSFSKEGRTQYPAIPLYRFQGNNLWVIGSLWNATSFVVRMGYYPLPYGLYFPNVTQTFSTGLTDFQQTTISDVEYVPGFLPAPFDSSLNPAPPSYNGMLAVQQGTGILYISNNTSTVNSVLASAAALSMPEYYKGVMYWIQAGNIYGAIFNPAAPVAVTPVQMTSSGTVTFIEIDLGNIVFVDGGVTKSAAVPATPGTITGTAVTSPFTPPSGVLCYGTASGYPYWVTSAGVLTVNNVALSSVGTVTLATDDSTYIYAQVGLILYRLTIDYSTPSLPVLYAQEQIASDVYKFASAEQGYIPVVGKEVNQIYIYSTTPDKVITYPNNLAYEIMAYRTAYAIKRKQTDITGMQALSDYLGTPGDAKSGPSGLYARFLDQIRRDDYYPERISNNRISNSAGGLMGIDF